MSYKVKTIVISLVIIAGITAAAVFLISEEKPPQPTQDKEQQVLNFAGEELEKSSTEDQPVNVEDPISFCEQQQNSQACKDNFYYRQATEEQDRQLCSKIKDPELKKQCEEQIIVSAPKKVEVCRNLEGDLNQVCTELSTMTSSREGRPPTQEECQNLENSTAKQICLSMARNQDQVDPSSEQPYAVICEGLSDSQIKRDCFTVFEAVKQARE